MSYFEFSCILSLGIDDLQIQLPSNTKADFDNVLATQKPTVSEADLKVY